MSEEVLLRRRNPEARDAYLQGHAAGLKSADAMLDECEKALEVAHLILVIQRNDDTAHEHPWHDDSPSARTISKIAALLAKLKERKEKP